MRQGPIKMIKDVLSTVLALTASNLRTSASQAYSKNELKQKAEHVKAITRKQIVREQIRERRKLNENRT